jgi:hypothetical protein
MVMLRDSKRLQGTTTSRRYQCTSNFLAKEAKWEIVSIDIRVGEYRWVGDEGISV